MVLFRISKYLNDVEIVDMAQHLTWSAIRMQIYIDTLKNRKTVGIVIKMNGFVESVSLSRVARR